MASTTIDTKLTIENVREQIVGIDKQVPLYNGTMVPYIFFDNGASTPILQPVLDKVNEFMSWYSSVHRGSGFKSQVASRAHEESRDIVANFVNACPEEDVIIFGKNATEAINILAHCLNIQRDKVILVSKMEHHSNDLPWRYGGKVVHVELDDSGKMDLTDLKKKLEYYNDRVALFAVSGASNVSGWVNDIHTMAEMCHKYGVKIMVDAAQMIPHRKIDMLPHDDPRHIDFLAFSAHKIYAPLGAGVLIGPKKAFEENIPATVGGGTVSVVSLDYTYWADAPEKEEAGSPNTAGIVALAKALQVMDELGMDKVAAHEAHLTNYVLNKLKEFPEITIYGGDDPDDVEHRMGVISFNVRGVPNALTAAILNWEGGIGVRNGCFCAQPYMKHLLQCSDAEAKAMEEKIFTKNKIDLPGAVRASFGIYNTTEEIDRFIDVLRTIVKREWKGDYEEDPASGDFHLKNSPVALDSFFTVV
ncbi:MAG: aminotransferase class V-fold PLP-dependent enzyme [Calditrichia bacterium]